MKVESKYIEEIDREEFFRICEKAINKFPPEKRIEINSKMLTELIKKKGKIFSLIENDSLRSFQIAVSPLENTKEVINSGKVVLGDLSFVKNDLTAIKNLYNELFNEYKKIFIEVDEAGTKYKEIIQNLGFIQITDRNKIENILTCFLGEDAKKINIKFRENSYSRMIGINKDILSIKQLYYKKS